ncbi:HAD family hydrolase [uncultured Ilyobacter sp.]|uniref:HAD family hydrolase n=1 Tax=uncultured Ilyobacter sp. TaxID=544433 RepID=UPI0029C6B236|nr:HAD family hydrolase [uncultured Ilyobacter sp.]
MKILSFDLDGTLLTDDKKISERTLKALLRCKEDGKVIAFNSGRPTQFIYSVLPKAFHEDIVISSNGALVYKNKKLIHENPIDKSTVWDIIQMVETVFKDIFFVVEQDDRSLTKCQDREYNEQMFCQYHDFTEESITDSPKILLKTGDLDYFDLNILNMLIPESCRLIFTDNMEFAQVVHADTDKLYGVKKILEIEKIDLEELVAFGDDLNDLEILSWAGYSVAMGNAVEEIKNVSKYIADTNERDGVAKFIEEYVLKKIEAA